MSIGEAIFKHRKSNNLTQSELAKKLPIDRSVLARIENGSRELPQSYDAALSACDWRIALTIADERTGGFISNILEDLPNLDLHPSALKELLMKELREAQSALGGLIMAKHVDPEKRKSGAAAVWSEIRDVIEKAVVLQGVIEEEFGLNRKELIKKHEGEVKRGER